MKRSLLLGLALAGCGPNGAAAPTAPASTPAAPTTASPPTTAAPVGAMLHGSVSSLSGSITGFAVRVTDTATIVALDTDVLFDFDSAQLKPEAATQLGKTADTIRSGGAGAIAIEGFTDSKGGDAYNLELSRRRAQAVADWMRTQPGVRQRDFTVTGKGEADPVAPNQTVNGSDDPTGRAKNRRVEIVVPK